MIPSKFIPPKDDDIDYNPEIDSLIELQIESGFPNDEDYDIRDQYDDADDLININIG